ncbi:lipid phosphate phosphatase epsilon 2, chloroplastic-like [Nymphaea colorata]|nr:lipid phosphate phosphatase epsilon 2, chloroplastic-like [Nymphaea colorata]
MPTVCAPSYGSMHFSPSSFLHLRPVRFIPFRKLPILNSSRVSGFCAGTGIVGSTLKASRPRRMIVNSQSGFAGGSEGRFLETEDIPTNGLSSVGRENDSSGWEARINHSSKWVVLGIFCAFVIAKHDPESLWATIGSVSNSIISVCLKHLLNHERPMSALRTDPGMPSSHAQSILYVTVYASLSLANWLGINALSIVLATLTLGCGCYLSWLRVSQGFHTTNQILVGAIIGSVFSAVWFWLWHRYVQTAYTQHLWVPPLLIIGFVLFSLGFGAYVFRHWVVRQRQISV